MSVQTPVFQASKLKKACFTDIQEMFEAFAASLVFSEDIVRVIEGAKGASGEKGDKGDNGDDGNDGETPVVYSETVTIIPIPNNVTYVEIPATRLNDDKFKIISKREINPETGSVGADYPVFVAGDGYFAMGPLVPDDQNNKTRLYVVFTAGITATPNDDFALVWTKASTIV